MKTKDKVIVAFLVSIGMFSATMAVRYVSTLSETQKQALMPSVKSSGGVVFIADAVIDDDNHKNKA